MSVKGYQRDGFVENVDGSISVQEEILDLAFNLSTREEIPFGCDKESLAEYKASYIGHLVSPEGPNYDEDEGYQDLDHVDRTLEEVTELAGSENRARDKVVGVRNELRERDRKEHADQLENVLIGKYSGKLSCSEVKGGQGIHPGDPLNRQSNANEESQRRERDHYNGFGIQAALSDDYNVEAEDVMEDVEKAFSFLNF